MDIMQVSLQLVSSVYIQIIIVLIIILTIQVLIRHFLATLIRPIVRKHKYSPREARQREQTLVAVFHTGSSILLWLTAALIALDLLNINLAPFLTGAGLIGVLIGFGAQSTIRDFVAGFFVIVENQYRVGDIIRANVLGVPDGLSGSIENISIRATKLRDLDGTVHIIPNGQIVAVSNMTLGFANVNLDITIPYDTDVKLIEKLINKVGAELAKEAAWKEKIIEPIRFLRVDTFGDETITVKALGKVQPAEQWDVAGEYRRRLKEIFVKNKIIMVEEE